MTLSTNSSKATVMMCSAGSKMAHANVCPVSVAGSAGKGETPIGAVSGNRKATIVMIAVTGIATGSKPREHANSYSEGHR